MRASCRICECPFYPILLMFFEFRSSRDETSEPCPVSVPKNCGAHRSIFFDLSCTCCRYIVFQLFTHRTATSSSSCSDKGTSWLWLDVLVYFELFTDVLQSFPSLENEFTRDTSFNRKSRGYGRHRRRRWWRGESQSIARGVCHVHAKHWCVNLSSTCSLHSFERLRLPT